MSDSHWVPLSQRAIDNPAPALTEGITVVLYPHLQKWLCTVMDVSGTRRKFAAFAPGNTLRTLTVVEEVKLRLGLAEDPWDLPSDDPRLLDVVDATLVSASRVRSPAFRDVEQLQEVLAAGRSVWRVREDGNGLERRVDATVAAAYATTLQHAAANAADHLAAAWAAAYSRHPDPDKVFNEAVRAVESIACPLVEERKTESGKATLGTVIGELATNASHKWELVLPGSDGAPGVVAPLVTMLNLLWKAQVSRHAGAPKSRRQDNAEADAALHLTVTIVRWLSTGVLRNKGAVTAAVEQTAPDASSP